MRRDSLQDRMSESGNMKPKLSLLTFNTQVTNLFQSFKQLMSFKRNVSELLITFRMPSLTSQLLSDKRSREQREASKNKRRHTMPLEVAISGKDSSLTAAVLRED